MFSIRRFLLALPFFALPGHAFASCAEFSGFDAENNWHADIEARVESALMCERWLEGFDQSALNHAQGFIVQSLLSDQEHDDALVAARSFFDDAIQRYDAFSRDPEHADASTAERKLHSRLKSNLKQTGMLLADAETLVGECHEGKALEALIDYVRNAVGKDVEKSRRSAEKSRKNLEQQLEEYSLETWQEYYPEASSKEQLREIGDLKAILEPDVQSMISKSIDTQFMSLFTTSIRVESGRAEQCLAEAFGDYPEVAKMDAAERERSFPRSSGFIKRNLVE